MLVRRDAGRFVAEEPRQSLAEHQAGPQLPDLDRFQADARDVGRFARREPLDFPQHEHQAVLLIEAAQGFVDRLPRFIPLAICSGDSRQAAMNWGWGIPA